MDPAAVFGRTLDLLGEEGFSALRAARVLVVGLGGVGSHAAVALARAGVGRLCLVDFDPVTPSSLNRHACAGLPDLGRPKAEVVARYLRRTVPDVEPEALLRFFHDDTAEELLGEVARPALVLDAIDSFSPKVALLRGCVERGLPVISSMGASARTDPTLLRVADIAETRVCPLARVVRRRLRRHGITGGITTVYSEEAPLAPLPPDEADQTLQRGRPRRRLPSLSVMPGIFGYTLAALALSQLSGVPFGEAR